VSLQARKKLQNDKHSSLFDRNGSKDEEKCSSFDAWPIWFKAISGEFNISDVNVSDSECRCNSLSSVIKISLSFIAPVEKKWRSVILST
jgi:hypothetical protein